VAVFVLVHGAWHGGWCWRRLAPLLRAAGHEVVTPTLTGLGERSHLAHPEVGLATHVEDIVQVLVYEDLSGVVLVGHSYGGIVITGVAERVPERLAHLVYLEAFVPEDGQSLVDLMPAQVRQRMEAMVQAEGDGWLLPRPLPSAWEAILRDAGGVTDDEDIAWMVPRLGPQPFRTMTEPVRCVNPAAAALPRTYVRGADNTSPTFVPFAERARAPGSGWQYAEVAASHAAMVTAPRDLAVLLLGIVEG
jgi:pimeloyl-ACP methyl ester carboxylesterase